VYLETMGRRGIQEVAHQCAQKAAYASKAIGRLDGYSLPFTGSCFNEFVVRGPIKAVELLSRLGKQKGIDGGIALSRFMTDRPHDFLVCVTEVNTREQIDALVDGLKSL
jgi:glycine dehydrogenase subunit 1